MTALSDHIQRAGEMGGTMNAEDLKEIFSAFEEVTGALQVTHESLRAEVVRLQGELAEANEQLRRSRELAALGEMAAGIAHEIRNPLGSIGLYASMLTEDLADRPEQAELAGKISSAVRGLNHIVCDVLTFSRQSGVRPEPIDAAELLRDAVDCSLDAIRDACATIVLPDDTSAGGDLVCDPSVFRQALVNLVRNAAEAVGARADGARRIDISGSPFPGCLKINMPC